MVTTRTSTRTAVLRHSQAVLYQDISHIRKMRSHGGDACVVWPMTRCSEPS